MKRVLTGVAVLFCWAAPADAEDLFRRGNWSAMSSDRRASAVGVAITIVIYQAVDSSNVNDQGSRKSTNAAAGLRAGHIAESGNIDFGGSYAGHGEARRSERLVAQLSVSIESILPNGDFVVVGRQEMRVGGDRTRIAVRGRIRPEDIASDNRVLSSRIVDAEIDYDGKGFVSRSAKPGIVNRLFGLLGLG
jgi:flagellar L-ring protein precursor FlgH